MAIIAKMYIGNQVINLINFKMSFKQNTDYTGRPTNNPLLQVIDAVYETSKDVDIAAWSIHADMLKKVIVEFSPGALSSKTKRYEFYDVACTLYKEGFNGQNSNPALTTIGMSAAIFKYGNTISEKSWKVSDIHNQVTPTEIEEEKEEKPIIKEAIWISENGKQLTQSNGLNTNVFYGEKVKLKVITQHTPNGEDIEITIKGKTKNGYITLTDQKNTLQQTLTVTSNEAISEPIYLDPVWYNEDIETYNYTSHQTKIDPDETLTLVFDAKLESGDQKESLPKDNTAKLKPITYRRNYEELIGLFNTDNSGEKDKENNYENKFINSNTKIKNIVDEFIEKVIAEDITIAEIKTLVEEKATVLWNAAVKQAQSGNFDDRPLYWARNKMQTWLKRIPLFKDQIDLDKSIVKKGTEIDDIIILFEEKSRNYTGIDFSTAGNKKKVLITGFDPFILNEFDNDEIALYSPNILQSNPSGCVALKLATDTIEKATIQTMIVPVRYSDFDNSQSRDRGQGKGIIEKHIAPFINVVDMIITISQAGPNDYNIDKFATAMRGGFNGNLNHIREEGHSLNTNYEWIETTLPKEMTNTPLVEFNWEYNRSPNPKHIQPAKNQILYQGSGGDYLSNEIFYRVAKLRKDNKPNLPTGHFHIAKLQSSGDKYSNKETKKLYEIVKSAIEKGTSEIK